MAQSLWIGTIFVKDFLMYTYKNDIKFKEIKNTNLTLKLPSAF